MGVTVEVDDKSLARSEFVRMKIACRDITKVPPVVEGAILPYLYDFEFERDVVIPVKPPVETVQVPIGGSNIHPSPKKPRLTLMDDGAGGSKIWKGACESAHPKSITERQVGGTKSQQKIMGDAMKTLSRKKGTSKRKDQEMVDISWNASDDELLYEEALEGQEEQSKGNQNIWLARCSFNSHMMKNTNEKA